jgi:hypothetical protein
VAQPERDGDVRGLVQALEDAFADAAIKAFAAGALAWLACDNASTVAVVVVGALPLLVELLRGGSDKGRSFAAATLAILACKNANLAAVMAAGALPSLVELLRSGSDQGRANAAAALCKLVKYNDDNKAVVLAAGAIAPLVEMLRDGGSAEVGRRNAARALYILTSHKAGQRQVAGFGYTRGQLKALSN